MSSNPTSAIASLRLIAAAAQKLADDVAGGRLWPGEYSEALAQIERAMRDAKEPS